MKPHPYARTGTVKLIGFLIHETKRYAYILDNYVWGVHVKELTIDEFKGQYTPSNSPTDQIQTILKGLASYAVYAGMTLPAARVLPLLIPMSEGDIKVATDKGNEMQDKFNAGAEAEAKKDGVPKKLFGAALKSYNTRMERETAAAEAAAVKSGSKPLPLPPEAVAAHAMAAEVSEDLTKIEEAGDNPQEVIAPKPKKPASKAPKPEPKPKVEKPTQKPKQQFDAAKLKGADGEYKAPSGMFKGLLLEGKLNDDQIFKAVQKKFGLDDSKRGYVAWNRGWLVRNNLLKAGK